MIEPGTPVQVNNIWAFASPGLKPLREWLWGYEFVRYEDDAKMCVVKIVDGPLRGSLVRYHVDNVRTIEQWMESWIT